MRWTRKERVFWHRVMHEFLITYQYQVPAASFTIFRNLYFSQFVFFSFCVCVRVCVFWMPNSFACLGHTKRSWPNCDRSVVAKVISFFSAPPSSSMPKANNNKTTSNNLLLLTQTPQQSKQILLGV